MPKLIRCDCGTENSVIAYLQPFLCKNSKSFRYGTSIANQVHIIIIHLVVQLSEKYINQLLIHRELRHFRARLEDGVLAGG